MNISGMRIPLESVVSHIFGDSTPQDKHFDTKHALFLWLYNLINLSIYRYMYIY
jgi:hypothetical protein